MKIVANIFLIFFLFSCSSTKDKLVKEKYIPDLKIKTVEYSINPRIIESTDPGKPRGAQIGLVDIELNITIENIGSGDWFNDLCTVFLFDEDRPGDTRAMFFENVQIAYASKTTRSVTFTNLIRRPNTITIIINPREEIFECHHYYEESFYTNNSYRINL